jgi:DNA-directed RNA polymerase subunit beta
VAGTIVKFGNKSERRDYSRIQSALELPNLVEIQTKSYEWFLTDGIDEILKDMSPVEDFSGKLSLEFVGFEIDDPKYQLRECQDRDLTFSAPLRVQVRLHNHETGEVKEQEVFLGDVPLMSETGTFIVNGAERVIVSQLVRSPSVYFGMETDKNNRSVFTSNIIPNRGTWLEFEMDAKNVINVRIDRTRKMPATVLLRALGLATDQEIIDLFGESEFLQNTLDKDTIENTEEALMEIYSKLRPGEPATLDSSKNLLLTRFFDDRRYDLSRVGRYKFNKKLNVVDRVLNQIVAEDIVDPETGEVVVPKGSELTAELLMHEEVVAAFENGFGRTEVTVNDELEDSKYVQIVRVVDRNNPDGDPIIVIGNDQSLTKKHVTISDIFASFGYYLNLLKQTNIGKVDEIDHLGNRRVRSVGELLQNQFRIGLSRMERVIKERMSTQEIESVTPKSLINIRPVTAAIKEFFGSSQLSQFMDQTNPLAELTNKRRLSALGPGGLSRERAGFEVRDVHYSHYGRICPIETPEGPNIGLINNLATYARIIKYGFIQTPYRRVEDHIVTDHVDYLTADEERDYVVAQANINLDENNMIASDRVVARYRGETILVDKDDVNYVDVSPKQIVSVATAAIPFLEHDDANRALMGANMQRQAIPLLRPASPLVGTGVEHVAARDSGVVALAKNPGVVSYVDSRRIEIKNEDGLTDRYPLTKYSRSNQGTCYSQTPLVEVGEEIFAGDVLADGPSTENGEIALGQNPVVAFMTWNGYNYEDAIIMSERLVKEDIYTSIHIEDYETESRDTKLGPEEITRDIPNVGEDARKNLDVRGIIKIGTEVKSGDILVGKVTPKGATERSSEERLLHAIFGEKAHEVRDTSLRVPHGAGGIIHDVKVFSRANGDELPPGVNEVVRVYIVQKRKINEGDKMAGRHGNKGVISRILPQEDMPYLPDGRPVDIMLNPLGVPSRMNIGQILEIHLGMAAKQLGIKVSTPVFDGASQDDVLELMAESGMEVDGKTELYDGRTGEKFDHRVAVGVMHMIKLSHMVDDKLHARSTGPYSLVTQQPLGGKAQFGGQRFGEMEVWALEAYGAAHTLQEILTIKSDDVVGRVKVYEALVKGEPIPDAGMPESFRVLVKELQALGIDVEMLDKNEERIDLKTVEDVEEREENNFGFQNEVQEDFDVEQIDY